MINTDPTTTFEHSNTWICATVLHGDQVGRTINFPSLNLAAALWPTHLQNKPGVYSAKVRIGGKKYLGALYFGPRLVKGETHNVLEIHVLDFAADVYDQTVEFQIGKFIRPPLDFVSLEGLKEQLVEDVWQVRNKV
ncbi:MAG: hypothetical protein A3A82_00345 [Candidatus Pacebacteria bacterium RIFCSPLOWO2_01_FULL_47_12]|nr:MAG: hypothetical protein A3J60_03380 [Candidatus Pacebacteria bacterium RIFCSPHIGHO2_02_FULL_46_9]OGJ39239.1 MAG: hypothetical protein A3A82_00345 [Candidatus Pacebacteria bacterium RIFCSPLOWO2_01_FULL_47_12]